MKLFLTFVLILYCVQAKASQLIVQASTLTSLYGQRLIESINAKNVIYLQHGVNAKDAEIVISAYMRKHNFNSVLILGCMLDLPYSSHHPILSQITLKKNMFDAPVYLISSKDRIAKLRATQIKQQLKVEEREVDTEYDLRREIQALAGSPNGFIILNVFNYKDSWGQVLTFKDAEQVLVGVNHKHMEVGICHSDFKTALALGPIPEEVAALLDNTTTNSVCASLPRLKKLGKLGYYTQHMGEFSRVVAPDY